MQGFDKPMKSLGKQLALNLELANGLVNSTAITILRLLNAVPMD